jgi:hypothetical protein
MLGKELMVNAGIVVKAFELSFADKLEEILVAGLVFGEEQKMGGFFIELRVAFAHGAGGQVSFDADDRFDTGGSSLIVELDHPEHGAMIGQRDRAHAHFFDAPHELLDVAEAIEEGVFGVDVKVDKTHRGPDLIIAREGGGSLKMFEVLREGLLMKTR